MMAEEAPRGSGMSGVRSIEMRVGIAEVAEVMGWVVRYRYRCRSIGRMMMEGISGSCVAILRRKS